MKMGIKASIFAVLMMLIAENQAADSNEVKAFDGNEAFINIRNNTNTMVPIELDIYLSESYIIPSKKPRSSDLPPKMSIRSQDLPTLHKSIEGQSECIVKLSECAPLTSCLKELQSNELYNIACMMTLNFNKGTGKGQDQKQFSIHFWSKNDKNFPLNNKFVIDPYVCNHDIEIVIPDFDIYRTR